jgi:hypothetical protein
MDAVELRPLTLGEILDRTFTMYRRHFLFFVTLAGLFHLPSLLVALVQAQSGAAVTFTAGGITLLLIAVCVSIVTSVLASGGAVLAISEFYLGHTVTIGETVRRILGRFWALLGAAILTYFAFMFGFLFFFVPGIYVLCRVLITAPVVVVDRKGPAGAFSRSWALSQGFAGRAFLILVLYLVVVLAASAVSTAPLQFMIREAAGNPAQLRWLLTLQAVIGGVAGVLIAPIIQISTAIFYYDLRVRKEAFDLHFMMNPDAPADDSRFLTEA